MEVARFNIARYGLRSMTDVLGAMESLPRTPLAAASLGAPLLVVQDFAAAQQVLIGDVDSYAKPGLIRRVMVSGLGRNLFTHEGDEWLERRRPIAPVFAAAEMNSLASIMASTLDRRIAAWQPATIDMQAEMTDLTLDVACRALLGVDPAVDELGERIRSHFAVMLDWLAAHLSNPALPPAWIPTPGNRAMKAAKADLQTAIGELIEDRRSNGNDGDDVLGRLIRSQRDTGAPTDAEMIDECIGFLFAGHETTASTLTWALYELATDPEVQAQVAAEGDNLDLSSSTLHDDAVALAATDRVVEEILRLYPSGVAIARVAKRSTEIAGHRVRRGTMVMIAVYRVQRQPDVWQRPDQFEPERPVPPTESGLRNSFLAFGLGPAQVSRRQIRSNRNAHRSRHDLFAMEPDLRPARTAGTGGDAITSSGRNAAARDR